MFTGIVRELGVLAGAEEADGGRTLVVRAADTAADTIPGDSVSINGCCLTATAIDAGSIAFDAVPETLARSTLGDLEPEDRVNVEPAIRAGEALGGHYVQGHVDAVGQIQSVEAEGEGLRVLVEAPDDVLRYCVEKGSITVDGVSLTVSARGADVGGSDWLEVSLIPTTLAALEPGQRVNLEADVLAKYVERLIARG